MLYLVKHKVIVMIKRKVKPKVIRMSKKYFKNRKMYVIETNATNLKKGDKGFSDDLAVIIKAFKIPKLVADKINEKAKDENLTLSEFLVDKFFTVDELQELADKSAKIKQRVK